MKTLGINVISSRFAVTHAQYRFPRSKKRRIRNKWAKRDNNYRQMPSAFMMGGTLYAHPDYIQKIINFPTPMTTLD